MKTIESFGVSAAVSGDQFLALVLKFRFDTGSELLTAWPRPMIFRLLKALGEYAAFLQTNGISIDLVSEEARDTMALAPVVTLPEIEGLSVASVVASVDFHISKGSRDLQISIVLEKSQEREVILLNPKYVEWLIGFIGNTLEEFDESGQLPSVNGARH